MTPKRVALSFILILLGIFIGTAQVLFLQYVSTQRFVATPLVKPTPSIVTPTATPTATPSATPVYHYRYYTPTVVPTRP